MRMRFLILFACLFATPLFGAQYRAALVADMDTGRVLYQENANELNYPASLTKIMDYVARTKCRLFLLKGREIEKEIMDAKRKYKFNYELTPSKTGDGFIISVRFDR